MSRIAHGVDGFGVKHYLCNHCELQFGPVDPDTITHVCDLSKPKYHSRGYEQAPDGSVRRCPSLTKR